MYFQGNFLLFRLLSRGSLEVFVLWVLLIYLIDLMKDLIIFEQKLNDLVVGGGLPAGWFLKVQWKIVRGMDWSDVLIVLSQINRVHQTLNIFRNSKLLLQLLEVLGLWQNIRVRLPPLNLVRLEAMNESRIVSIDNLVRLLVLKSLVLVHEYLILAPRDVELLSRG